MEHTKSQVPLIDDSNHARWYRDPSSIKKIEEEISNFTEFVKTYKKDKRFVFAVTAASDHKEGSISGSTIYVYNRGILRKATDQNSNSGIKTTEMFASTMASVVKDVAFDAFEKEMIERTLNNIRNEKWLSDGKIMHKHIDLHLAQLLTDGDIDGTLKRIGQPQLHLTKVLHQLISRKIPNIDREWRNFVNHLKNAIKAAARVSAVLDIDRAQRFVDKLRDEFSKIFHSDFLENSFRMNCSETYEDCDNANKKTFQEECVREFTKILKSLQFKTTNQQEFDNLLAPKVIEFVKFLNEPTCMPRCDAYCPLCKSLCLEAANHDTSLIPHDTIHQPKGIVGKEFVGGVHDNELVPYTCNYSYEIDGSFVKDGNNSVLYINTGTLVRFSPVEGRWKDPLRKEALPLREYIFAIYNEDIAEMYGRDPYSNIPSSFFRNFELIWEQLKKETTN